MALKDKLNQINKLKLELDALLPMSVENEKKWWEKIRLEWNYNSNHIEGNTLTYGETKLLLIFDKTTGDHELREYKEMKAHDVAIQMVKEWAKDENRGLTERDIRELNNIILVEPYWKEAITPDGQATRRQIKVGEYKEYPNSVQLKTGEVFDFASPLETPQKMFELIEWYRKGNDLHPLIIASKFHYDFIRIHPFDDGNGRVARLIVNYVMMKNNLPPIIVKSSEKEKYLTALNKADVGDIDAFHEYMADQLIWSLEVAIKAAKGESIEEVDDAEKEVMLWKKQFKRHKADVMPKSDKRIHELYAVGIKSFLDLYLEKMKIFDDLFTSKEVLGFVNSANMGNRGLDYIDSEFINWFVIQVSLNAGTIVTKQEQVSFDNISLQISWRGFNKDGVNAFGIHSTISIIFQPYVYTINFNHETIKEFLYAESIDSKAARNIISTCTKKIHEEIRLHVRGNKNQSSTS